MLITEQHMDRRSRRTRDALKAALVSLMNDRGYESVTVSEIAEAADYNRGTFYKHFPGKPELLQAVLDDFMEGVSEAYAQPYRMLKEISLDGVIPSTPRVFEYIDQHKAEFKALYNLYGDMSKRLYSMFYAHLTEQFVLETEHSEQPIEYDILLSYEISATVGVIMHWAATDFKYSASFMSDQLTALINVKPVKLVNNERATNH